LVKVSCWYADHEHGFTDSDDRRGHGRPAGDSIDQCEFVIDLQAAKAFALTMPAGLLAIADKVIE
jgi:hypothetical protein